MALVDVGVLRLGSANFSSLSVWASDWQEACNELEAAQRTWLEAAAFLRAGARRAPGGALPLA